MWILPRPRVINSLPDNTLAVSLDYAFTDPALLREALTHRSYGVPHNERLEFLGDAVLGFLVAEMLFNRFPEASEGDLSRMRAAAVCGEQLASVAVGIGLGQHLLLGHGEASSGGRERTSTLANALEAIIAAVCLDGGIGASRVLVSRLFEPVIREVSPALARDPKSRLQELLQARGYRLPQYQLQGKTGEEHAASFCVQCSVQDFGVSMTAESTSRKKAEQLAAAEVLQALASRGVC